MSLTLRAVCGAGTSAGTYLMDEDPNAGDYTTIGSYHLTTTGSGHANLVHTGATPGPNLPTGLGSMFYSETASGVGFASEFVLTYNSGGGVFVGDVLVTRGATEPWCTSACPRRRASASCRRTRRHSPERFRHRRRLAC